MGLIRLYPKLSDFYPRGSAFVTFPLNGRRNGMQTRVQRITPFLWFDNQAEAAEAAGRAEGSAMTVVFRLDGQEFVALNGGPIFKFSEAMSFVVNCASQD